MQVSDEKLLLDFIDGDERSFQLLVDRHKRVVFKFILLKVKNREIASDLTQDVFVRIYQSAEKFKFYGKFYSWMMRIAQNVCIDFFRKKKGKKEDVMSDLERDLSDQPIHQFNPENDVEKDEKSYWVRKAIENLPDEQREAIVFCHYFGLNYRQIAEIQNCPLGTVKSRIHNSIHKIQQFLQSNGLEL